jgi:DNA-binding GntR family transcriptional regulator
MGVLTVRTGRRGLRELAYLSIRDAIVTQQLAPGERITEEALSTELGVSRPVLREALQRLQFDQLVDRLNNGRMRVRPITIGDTAHLYAVRSALEQLTVREALPRLTDTHLAELTAIVGDMRSAERSFDDSAVVAAGSRFHHLLAHIAANPVNAHLMDQIRTQIDRLRHVSVKMAARPHESVSEHAAILDALQTRDPDTAARAMASHIQSRRAAALHTIQKFIDAGCEQELQHENHAPNRGPAT